MATFVWRGRTLAGEAVYWWRNVGRRFAATAGLAEVDREGLLEFGNELAQREEVICATGDTFPDDLRQATGKRLDAPRRILIRANLENVLALQLQHRRDVFEDFRYLIFSHFSHAAKLRIPSNTAPAAILSRA